MIGKVLKSKFDNDANLYDLMRGRIFPQIAPQTTERPFAVYDIISVRAIGSKDADSHIDEVNVTITFLAEKYSIAHQCAEASRSALVRMREDIDKVNVQTCMFDNQSEAYNVDEQTYAVDVDFVFRVIKD